MQRFLMLFAALLAACTTAIAQPQSNDSPPMIAGSRFIGRRRRADLAG